MDVLRIADVGGADLRRLLNRYGLRVEFVADDAEIPHSFWGAPEAGIAALSVFIRSDTPIHSLLHETGHIVCMSEDRRDALRRDAGGDDIEEAAVCYLQILLADCLPGVGRDRLMADMDRWGYSFRLGSTHRWFTEDATDARDWLLANGLVDPDERPTFRFRAR